jgi:hypothetical protein
MISPQDVSFQNHFCAPRSSFPRGAVGARLVLPHFTCLAFPCCFRSRPSSTSLRTSPMRQGLPRATFVESRSCAGRVRNLPALLLAGGWGTGDRSRCTAARLNLDVQRPRPPRRNRSKCRSAARRERCSIDCGVTHRRCSVRFTSQSREARDLDCHGLDAIGRRIKTGTARTAQELWMCCKSVEQEARARSDEARLETKFQRIKAWRQFNKRQQFWI